MFQIEHPVIDQHNKLPTNPQLPRSNGLPNQASSPHPLPSVTVWGNCLVVIALLLMIAGCGTTTKRMATEQLLMSNAVDQAIAKIDFQHIANQTVYLDTTYIKPVKSQGLVSSLYVISSIRQQLAAANSKIQDSRADADIIVEPRIGTLGADGHEVTFGIPKTGGITAAASALAGNPVTALPEISFAQSNAQSGVAKIYVFAYERQSKAPVWQSGVAKAESNCSSTWVLGAGPIQRGSIYDQTRFAGRRLNPVGQGKLLHSGLIDRTTEVEAQHFYDNHVIYDAPHVFAAAPELNATTRTADGSQLPPLEKSDAKLR